jgi:hypothetical protein
MKLAFALALAWVSTAAAIAQPAPSELQPASAESQPAGDAPAAVGAGTVACEQPAPESSPSVRVAVVVRGSSRTGEQLGVGACEALGEHEWPFGVEIREYQYPSIEEGVRIVLAARGESPSL